MKRIRLRNPAATPIQPVSVYMSRLGVELFSCDIFSPEVPLQIFLAAAKRCDS